MLEAKDTDRTGSLLSFTVTDDALKLQPASGINRPGTEAWRLLPKALIPA